MKLTLKNKVLRFIWNLVWHLLFRPFPFKIVNFWRVFLLKCFGAKISFKSGVYASCRIWAPWNLFMEDNAWLGPYVDCYNVAPVILEEDVTVSQKSYLCAASHDIYDRNHPLIIAPIIIRKKAWVGAAAFIGMGAEIGEGAVIGACAVLTKDAAPWTVYAGNPAKPIKSRVIKQ